MPIEYHPIAVHFPIALVSAAMIFDVSRWIFDRDRLLSAGFWGGTTPLLVFAFLGIIAAITSGLVAEPETTDLMVIPLLQAHKTLALVASGLLAILCFWRVALRGAFPRRAAFVYLVLLLGLTVVIGFGAYFGGQMVFSHGVGVDAAN